MKFNSLLYLIFLAVAVLLYWQIPERHRNRYLLLTSYICYGSWYPPFLLLLLASTSFNYYFSALAAKRTRYSPIFLTILVLGNISLLVYYKYLDFFGGIAASYIPDMTWTEMNIILPLGISFFTFEALSYAVDISKGKERPVDFLTFSLFLAFWPHLVAGPIMRAHQLIPQLLSKQTFSWRNIYIGSQILVAGLFIKVVLADNIAPLVDEAFLLDPKSLAFADVVVLGASFGFQIYFDFAGYSAMAVGSSLMLGIKIIRNFNFPYNSLNVQEFWTRWHISLSSWIRDYIYFLLGGSRKSKIRTILNLFTAMVICGLWHGAAMVFVLWGIYQGLLLVIHRVYGVIRDQFGQFRIHRYPARVISWILTFTAISIGWVIFRSPSVDYVHTAIFETSSGHFMSELVHLDSSILKRPFHPNLYLLTLLFMAGYWVVWKFRGVFPQIAEDGPVVPQSIKPALAALEVAGYGLLMLVALIYMGTAKTFIYFQF